jgi:hypothetical protein
LHEIIPPHDRFVKQIKEPAGSFYFLNCSYPFMIISFVRQRNDRFYDLLMIFCKNAFAEEDRFKAPGPAGIS